MSDMKAILWLASLFSVIIVSGYGQGGSISGRVMSNGGVISSATVVLENTSYGAITDTNGKFILNSIPPGNYILSVSFVGFEDHVEAITITNRESKVPDIVLKPRSEALSEVIITGVTRQTLIRENPIPVKAITTKEINLTTESNIVDVLSVLTPGMEVVKTGPNISKPLIRGLGYNRVLTLYDGIRQEGQQWGDEHGLEVDNYTIERAEVIKGPASLLYGSDALAGVVSLFPYIPKGTDKRIHGNLTSEYQTNDGLIGNGLRIGYGDEHWVFSLRGSYRMAKDYKNPVDGRVYLTGFKETNFSSLAGYKSAKGYTHLNFTLYNNRQGIPDGSRDSVTRKFTRQIFEADLDEPENRVVVTDRELNSYRVPDLSQHIQHYRLFVHSNYRIGGGDLDVLVAKQQNSRREYNHPTRSEQAGMYVRLNTLNYGIRYNAPQFSNLEVTVGVNGMTQHNKNLDATDFPIPNYQLFDFGAYVYGKWKKEKWTISGGVRYDLRNENWDDFYTGEDPVTGFIHQVQKESPDANLPFPAFQKVFHDASGSVGATYRITPKISLKANIGRAFRAPNISELASNGLDPGAHIIYLGDRTFEPEISLQEDIGAIAHFRNWSADISVFNNNVENYIYLDAVPGADGNPLVDNQGNRTYQYRQTPAQLYGGELWLSIHPESIKGLRFDNSISMVYGFNRSAEFKNRGSDGAYLPLIPPAGWRSNLLFTITLQRSWINNIEPRVGMEYAAAQDKFFGLNNTETRTPSYTLFSTGLSADIVYSQSNTLQLLFQVNNLFNRAYQSHLSRLKYFEDYANGNGIYSMGRNMTFKLMFGF